jgi:excisionase family DNA binding protein
MRGELATEADEIALMVGGIRLRLTPEQADDVRRQLGEPSSGLRVRRDEILTPDEAAPLMRHSAKTVRALCRLRKTDPRYLKHLRKGSKILIRRADVAEWIAGQIGEAG